MDILIAAAFTCADISEMVDRVRVNNTVSSSQKDYIVEIYQKDLIEAIGIECDWDANVD
tara:strand:- start:733 stop:909 length:177 start_codon:yes stop_codon:yes gene_type:complete